MVSNLFRPWLVFVWLFILSQFSDVLAASPSLKITHPLSGGNIEGYIVEVKFEVKNFVLKDYRTGSQSVGGQGHLNFWLDQERTGDTIARKWFRNTPYTFADVTPGDHTLVVEMVGNDGRSLEPMVRESIRFRTEKPLVSDGGNSTQRETNETATGSSVPQSERQTLGGEENIASRLRFPILAGLASLFLGILGTLILKK